MTLPSFDQIPIFISIPVGLIIAVIIALFVVRVIRAEYKTGWYRSPAFLIPIAPLVLVASFFTCKGSGLLIILAVVVALIGNTLWKRLRRQ